MESHNPRVTLSRELLSFLRDIMQRLEQCEDSDAVAYVRQLLLKRIGEVEAELDTPPSPNAVRGNGCRKRP